LTTSRNESATIETCEGIYEGQNTGENGNVRRADCGVEWQREESKVSGREEKSTRKIREDGPQLPDFRKPGGRGIYTIPSQ